MWILNKIALEIEWLDTGPLNLHTFESVLNFIQILFYSDLDGRFPVCSYSGMNYNFVAYFYKINAILVQPMTTRCDATIIDTFKDIYEYLKVHNLAPKLHILDNECSKAIQKYVKAERVAI